MMTHQQYGTDVLLRDGGYLSQSNILIKPRTPAQVYVFRPLPVFKYLINKYKNHYKINNNIDNYTEMLNINVINTVK